MKIRFALLGAGRIGKTHAKAISGNPRAELVAVFDPFNEAADVIVDQYGCKVMSLDEVAASSEIDAVVICTPTDTHAEFIIKYTDAGKAVFCEKPVDLDINRVVDCLEKVKSNKGKLMVGFNRRFDPHFAAVKADIEAGRIGKVEQVVISSRDPGLAPEGYIKVSGGIFRDMTIHDLDMARFLLGEEVVSVYATGSILIDDIVAKYDDYDTAMVVLRTASGKQAVINNSRRATYGYDQRVEVHGELGMTYAENPRPTLNVVANADGYATQPLHNFFMTRYIEAYAAEIDSFIATIAEDTEISPNGQDGLAALALADAAVLSAKEKREVSVSEVLKA